MEFVFFILINLILPDLTRFGEMQRLVVDNVTAIFEVVFFRFFLSRVVSFVLKYHNSIGTIILIEHL
jgi:hypothetical protein